MGEQVTYLFLMEKHYAWETVMDGVRYGAQSHVIGVWGIAGFFVAMLVVVSLFS
jgi:hypothetical protein